MKIVIDIPEELYTEYVSVQLSRGNGKGIVSKLLKAIKNGTPLPKRHGRIIDESEITSVYSHEETAKHGAITLNWMVIDGTDAPTIIEAYKSESEE